MNLSYILGTLLPQLIGALIGLIGFFLILYYWGKKAHNYTNTEEAGLTQKILRPFVFLFSLSPLAIFYLVRGLRKIVKKIRGV